MTTETTEGADRVIHLSRAGVSVLVRIDEGRLPRIVHWGAAIAPGSDLDALVLASVPPMTHNPNDHVWNVSVLPEFEVGWTGRPGVEGSRAGAGWSPAFRVTGSTLARDLVAEDGRTVDRLTTRAVDDVAALEIDVVIDLLESGLLRAAATVVNRGDAYTVGAVRIALPVPQHADELLDFTGRHLMERVPQRSSFPVGLHAREQRGGRTGLDAAFLLIAGESGFGYRRGEVWGTHVAWSGNQTLAAERSVNGARTLAGGELLQHGEIVLSRDEQYSTPWFYGAYGIGLDAMAARFHRHVRSGRAYPTMPRPVVVNSWEAVYFEHDLEGLGELARSAAELGAERFVLDDGWFGSRRDDTSGLGDWTVSADVWPDGLQPLIDRVHDAGLEFGLWVEPEMVNLDSDLARTHPEWLFRAGGRQGYSSRGQHVLDLTHPEAYAHMRDRLLALLDEYDIVFLKWDHNRQNVEAGHQPSGRPAVHGQTTAVYRLMDELREAHPGLEIESCASGGGRIDLGVLEHTQRVWGSDTNDPLERRRIHQQTQLLLPPEIIGAHVGSSPSHTTGRMHAMRFRASTPAWCSMGLELDVRDLDDADRAELAEWITFHRAERDLLHSGNVVNADHPDDALLIAGVVADDRRTAHYSVTALERSIAWPPGTARLPGLDPNLVYDVRVGGPAAPAADGTEWPAWATSSLRMRGDDIERVGLQLPRLLPEHSEIITCTAVTPTAPRQQGTDL